MKLNRIINEELKLQESLKQAVLAVFTTFDMDDSMLFTDARAFAYHIGTSTLFVDWLENRGHAEWFNDRNFIPKHRQAIEDSNNFDFYAAYRDGTMEEKCVWGRFGIMPVSTAKFEDLKIEITPEIEDLCKSGIPYSCTWAIGDNKNYLSDCANALKRFGLPDETVMYAAYSARQFTFDPFFIGEEWKASRKKADTGYAERWRNTIGDAVQRHLDSMIN
jgi:hypothetical protein